MSTPSVAWDRADRWDRLALHRGVLARAAATVVIAVGVGACFGLSPALFALTVGAAVTALGWAQTRLGAGRIADVARLLLIAAEVALVTAAIFAGDRFGPNAAPPAPMIFASPGLIVLLALLAVNTVTVRPLVVWWTGGCAAICWAVAAWLTLLDPTTLTKRNINDDNYATLIAYLEAVTQPHYFSLDALTLQFAVIVGCTLTLGVAAHRMRALARKTADRHAARGSLAAHFSPPVVSALLGSRDAAAPGARPVTALVCDLGGFTTWAAGVSAEAVGEALRGYHAFVEAKVFEHDGAVLNYIGDGVVAIFGLEGPGDSTVSDALGCARAMAETWPTAATGLFGGGYAAPLWIGLDHGEAVTGLVGEGRAMSLVVMGPALDSAEALQSVRPEGASVVVGAGAVAAAQAQGSDALRGFSPLPGAASALWGLAPRPTGPAGAPEAQAAG